MSYVGILTAPTFSCWPCPRRSSICRCCGCCGFEAHCYCCCCLAKMGVSRAHESVPRSFSLVHGTDPCTTEDLPLSVVLFLNNLATLSAQLNTLRLHCHAHRAAQYTSLAVLILPRALSARSPIFCSRQFRCPLPRISCTAQYPFTLKMVVQKK